MLAPLGAEALAEHALEAKTLAKVLVPKFLEKATEKVCPITYEFVTQRTTGFFGLFTRNGRKVIQALNLDHVGDDDVMRPQAAVTVIDGSGRSLDCYKWGTLPTFADLCENGEL